MPQLDERDRSDQKTTRVRIAVMALLCGLSFLTYYDRQCIVRAQEGIQESLAINDEQMGLVFGAFWLAYALFEIPGGWMGDRFGARLTLTRIVLAWSLFTALTGAATGFYLAPDVPLPVRRRRGGRLSEHGPDSVALAAARRARAGRRRALAHRALGRGIRAAASSARSCAASNPGRQAWAKRRPFQWLAALPSWRIGFFVSGVLGVVWCLAFYPLVPRRPGAEKLP